MNRAGLRRVLQPLVAVVAVGFLAWAVWSQRDGFGAALARLSVPSLLGALGAVLLALVLNMLSWRASMAAVGAHLPLGRGARVFFWSQLGKYVPGSVWPVLAQMELTRDSGVPRARGALGAVISMVVGVVTSTATGAALLLLPDAEVRARYGWLALAVAAGSVVLVPPVLRRVLALLVRVTRREQVSTDVDGAAIARSVGWSLVMWLALGVQAWLIARDLGGAQAPGLARATGAFALAWVVGFLVVISPAGLGAREAVLAVALGSTLSGPDALALALVSRALMTVGDGVAAGLASIRGRGRDARDPGTGTPRQLSE